jgi:hypothetical protein
MAQIFPPSANWFSKASVLIVLVFVGSLLSIILNINRLDYVSKVNVPIDQPVPFSHKHHVQGMGIDCRYCHTTVEESAFAGIPPTETCMTCHSQIWTEAPLLEPVRESYRTNTSLQWNRVHDLPDFVYFDHSIHLSKGIGCQSCHGQVDEMPLMWKANTLNMEWCLECHRAPEKFIRPQEEVFNMTWQAQDQESLGPKLVAEYQVQTSQLTNCSICHR